MDPNILLLIFSVQACILIAQITNHFRINNLIDILTEEVDDEHVG
jgi:hypothetical protein